MTDLMFFPEEKEAGPDTFLRSEKQNKIGVRVRKKGNPYFLDVNGTVDALFIKPDRTTIIINENARIVDDSVSLTLPNECYEQDGPIQIAIRYSFGNQITTLGIVNGVVYPSKI